MEEEIKKLTNKINELEEEIENKEILINVLVNDIKRNKNRTIEPKRKQKKESYDDIPKKSKWNSDTKTNDKLENKISTTDWLFEDITKEDFYDKKKQQVVTDKTKNQEICSDINVSKHKQDLDKIEHPPNWIYKYKLNDELDNMFNRKKVVKIFKDNVFIDEFADFCADTYFIKSFDEIFQISHAKNVKKYLQDNKTKITKYIIHNINKLSINIICSTLLCLSTEFTEDEKLVIVHDIILYVKDNSRIIFAVFCVLNSKEFFNTQDSDDVLRNTISSILSHQYIVDMDIHKNRKGVVGPLTNIKNLLGFKSSNKNIEDVLIGINTNISVFCKYKINPEIYKYMYSVRVLGHFLDWDYSYNIYIREYLNENINDCKILYLGLLTLNSLRLFGSIESTDEIFKFLLENMKGSDEISITSYLILKQINEKDTKEYIDKFGKDVENKGYDLEYLKKLIVY